MIMFFKNLQFGGRKGSALIVALLVMGVLVTLSLGISSLVIMEIRQSSDVVVAGQTYYVAESGVENAMYDLSVHMPGYSTDGYVESDDDGWIDFEYKIDNQGDSVPYFSDDEPVFLRNGGVVSKGVLYSQHVADTYNVLPLNETVNIPLFIDDGKGGVVDVKDFLLEYYVGYEGSDLVSGVDMNGFDVLRWKVFGEPSGNSNNMNVSGSATDAISDFFPAVMGNGAESPVCIGTDMALKGEDACLFPVDRSVIKSSLFVKHGVVLKSFDMWSVARSCYATDVGGGIGNAVGEDSNIMNHCSIKGFLDNHKKNYLSLTNIINPEVVKVSNPNLLSKKTSLYWRIVLPSNTKVPRSNALILSNGYMRDRAVKKSIDAVIGARSFLPVFGFSLYRTDVKSDFEMP